MKGHRLGCVVMFGWLAAGCASPAVPVVSDVNAVITGTLTELPVNEHVKTKELKRIKIHYKENGVPKRYEVLLGPNPGTGEEAEGWYHTSQPTIRVDTGFAVAAGDKPYGELEKVSAMTEGTTIIIQTLAGVRRVYLVPKKILGNDKVIVRFDTIGGIKEKIFTTNKWKDVRYVQTNAGMTDLEGPFDVEKAPPEIKSFVAYVRQRAIDARIIDAQVIAHIREPII